MKKELERSVALQEQAFSEISILRQEIGVLKREALPGSSKEAPAPQPLRYASAPALPPRPPYVKPKSDEIRDAYNEDPQSVKRTYIVQEFAVANMQQMWKETGVKPEFRLQPPDERGEYWLVEVGDPVAYAVPRFRQIYNQGQFRSGGMEQVFTCQGLSPGYRYRRLEVVKPARFRMCSGDLLELVETGVIQLGEEEKEV